MGWSQGEYNARSAARHAEDTAVVKGEHGVGWVRSYVLDDWFVEAQGGGQLYYGLEDRLGPFGDRLTGAGEFYIGRRIFPMWGFRVGLGYGNAHGFLSRATYDAYRTSIIMHSDLGECGTDPTTGQPYGGYYWDYDKDNTLLIQKWQYFYWGGDLFLDLGILRGANAYNPNKKWNNIVYGGIMTRYGLSEQAPYKNHRSEAHVGYIGKYNITQNWGVFADVRGSVIEGLFDREWVPELEPVNHPLNHVLNAQVGLVYRFHARTKEERDKFYTLEDDELNNNNITHFVHYVQVGETFETKIVDSIHIYLNEPQPTPETQAKIDSLQRLLADNLGPRKANADGQPLDSILLNELLPYEMVFFELDKWGILPSEEVKINRMAKIMRAYPEETFLLIGSADSKTGTVQRNDFLSHNRADVVFNALVNQYDIDPSRLERVYLGGILDYDPFELNRTTVIIMNHPTVKAAFEAMRSERRAGSGEVKMK